MLHILLFILKIISILIAVILGIILLAVCIVLFVPICYRAEAESSGTLEDIRARGRVSWLFGLVRVVIEVKDKVADFNIRIAWKSFGNSQKTESKREDTTSEKSDAVWEEQDNDPKEWEQPEYVEDTDVTAKSAENTDITAETAEAPKAVEKVETPEPYTQSGSFDDEKRADSSTGRAKKIQSKFHGISSTIKELLEKIKCTFRGFCDKIREILRKKEHVTVFITDEVHMTALKCTKQELWKLLKHLSPKILEADIRYGFEDPYFTGRVLAILGMFYPFYGEHAEITPDFQEKVLEGRLKIRGRIYVVHLAVLALNMLLCQEVRQTIKDIRNFKL